MTRASKKVGFCFKGQFQSRIPQKLNKKHDVGPSGNFKRKNVDIVSNFSNHVLNYEISLSNQFAASDSNRDWLALLSKFLLHSFFKDMYRKCFLKLQEKGKSTLQMKQQQQIMFAYFRFPLFNASKKISSQP